MQGESDPQGAAPQRPDYRHAVPVFAGLAVLIVAALLVRSALVPPSFGDHGYFRGDAMDEAKDRPSRYVGSPACADCHDEIAALHAKDAHGSVACETCHGPGSAHLDDSDKALARADRQEDCLVCHLRMDARPGSFPQIDRDAHYQFVGVADAATPCTRCHSGHEPLFMDQDLRKARLHPLVHDCGDCHLGRADEAQRQPPGHPQIFQCNYCHGAIAKSAAKASHQSLACTVCHLFIKDNAFSGRIVRDADPRFCLLCHRKTEFRTEGGTPLIVWPAHLSDFSDDPPDPKQSCVACHQDAIHELYPEEVPHGL